MITFYWYKIIISVKYYLSILNYHENEVYSVLKCKYISI